MPPCDTPAIQRASTWRRRGQTLGRPERAPHKFRTHARCMSPCRMIRTVCTSSHHSHITPFKGPTWTTRPHEGHDVRVALTKKEQRKGSRNTKRKPQSRAPRLTAAGNTEQPLRRALLLCLFSLLLLQLEPALALLHEALVPQETRAPLEKAIGPAITQEKRHQAHT